MHRFWNEQVGASATGQGVALALPLMYPDGLQVQVHLEQVAPQTAILSDRGETLARLHSDGLNLNAKETAALFESRKKAFDLQQHGFELRKQIKLPLDGIDVQLFAESLVSIAHLIYRFEPSTRDAGPAERQLRHIFEERNLNATWSGTLDGHVEKQIRVDCIFTAHRTLACKIVKRQGPMLAYMEQWAWRWTDIRKQNPRVLKGMVFDPDRQQWDETSTRIADEVCDFFCSYLDKPAINRVIDAALYPADQG